MILLYKVANKTYGGYTYIEADTVNMVYAKGNSSAHRGHGKGSVIETYVPTLKALKEVERQLHAFAPINNLYDYQEKWGIIPRYYYKGEEQ